MPYTYDHVHLRSADLPRAVDFYQRMLGARVVSQVEWQGRQIATLDIGGMNILLSSRLDEAPLKGSAEPHLGLEHFGLRTDNLERSAAELKAKGVEFLLEPTQRGPRMKIAFIRAPDDVRIELVERRS